MVKNIILLLYNVHSEKASVGTQSSKESTLDHLQIFFMQT